MEKKPIPKEYFNQYEEIANQLTKEDYCSASSSLKYS